MYNYLLLIEYDGENYCGWQRQPGVRTIQAALEDAAARIVGKTVKVTAAGRTDKGVHARGQAVTLRADKRFEPLRLQKALNALLPHDIAVRTVKEAGKAFNARYSAKEKVYHFHIWNEPFRSVWARQAWHIDMPLDLPSMRKAARALTGSHDFSAFEARNATQRCKRAALKDITISRAGGMIRLKFSADRFLYKMVRTITGTLVEVGLGKRTLSSVKELLKSKKRVLAGPTAPPHGLFLYKVEWGEVKRKI